MFYAIPFTPGHACGLHTLDSRFPPIAEQSVPPLRGTGLVQFRVLTWLPPPQDAEQVDQPLHSLYPPGTKDRKFVA